MSKHVIQCWNCGTRLTLDERSENDGECPECDSELALDDYFEDALTERDELRVQVEAMRLLLQQCDNDITEDGGVYIELRAFLFGTLPAEDVIALLGGQPVSQAKP